jgi:hypothetical protein
MKKILNSIVSIAMLCMLMTPALRAQTPATYGTKITSGLSAGTGVGAVQNASPTGFSGLDYFDANATPVWQSTVGYNNVNNSTILWSLTSNVVLIGVNNATVANFTTAGGNITGTLKSSGNFTAPAITVNATNILMTGSNSTAIHCIINGVASNITITQP